jgi:restriction endonuclease S subunit
MRYLNSEIGQLFFGKLQHESNQSNINLEEIKKIDIIMPEIDEQKNIIKELDKINDMILEKERQLCDLKKNFDVPLKRTLFK